MCKRCSELEIEIDKAEECGFGLTSFQLQEELEALKSSHLPKTARTSLETGTANTDSESNQEKTIAPGAVLDTCLTCQDDDFCVGDYCPECGTRH